MIYHLDSRQLSRDGLFLEDVLAMLLIKHCSNLNLLFERLLEKGLIEKNANMNGSYYLPEGVLHELEDAIQRCAPTSSQDEVIETLARKMIAMFPTGLKPGTRQSWRGNINDISRRLRKFQERYPQYRVDKILDATKRYVESFNGQYDYMRILKYFIWKDETKYNDEGHGYIDSYSDLANFIENEDAGKPSEGTDFATLV
jgi:hypothetical protein